MFYNDNALKTNGSVNFNDLASIGEGSYICTVNGFAAQLPFSGQICAELNYVFI